MGNTLGAVTLRELVYVPPPGEGINNSITVKMTENGFLFDRVRYENGSSVTYRWNASQASQINYFELVRHS